MLFKKHKQPRGVQILKPVKISGLDNIEFGDNIVIDSFSYFVANKKIKIGSNVFIACYVFLNGADTIEIGDFASIYQGARIHTSNDDFKHGGFGGPGVDDKYRNSYRAPVSIGKFAAVGANSVILPGVTIGEGASVGACSVVTHDLEPWAIYINNKKVGERNREAVMQNYKQYLADHGM